MTIEFKELFGLGAVSDEAIEARAEQAKAEMLPSHWGRYDDVTLENGLKIIRQTYTDGWDENMFGLPERSWVLRSRRKCLFSFNGRFAFRRS